MNLWVVAVLELDSHLVYNKRPDHATCACQKTHPIDYWFQLYYIADNQPFYFFLEVLTVHGTELRLFGAKAFFPTRTINVMHLT